MISISIGIIGNNHITYLFTSVCLFSFFVRCDCSSFLFYIGNIFEFKSNYNHEFERLHEKKYLKTFRKLIKHLICVKNEKRTIENYCIGSTCFAGPSPRFYNEDRVHHSMIPHPFKNSMPNSMVHTILKEESFSDLVSLCADATIKYLHQSLLLCNRFDVLNDNIFIHNVKTSLSLIDFIYQHVPKSLRICDTFFTQMVIVGNDQIRKHDGIKNHLDNDYISCIVNFGKLKKGGSTIYFNGTHPEKNCGKLISEVPFEHGRIQIGYFSEIVHGVTPWDGNRITINFNFKMDVVNHFMEMGSMFYKEYEYHGYPTDFVIKL